MHDCEKLLEHAEIGVLYADGEGNIRKISSVMLENTALTPEDVGRPLREVCFMEEYVQFKEDLSCVTEQKKTIERRIQRHGQNWIMKLCPIREQGITTGFLLVMSTIWTLNGEGLEAGKENDALTGLLKQRTVDDRIRERLWETICSEGNWLIMVDVDDFKRVINENGPLVGDGVICMVADELRNCFPDSLIGRTGRDAFVLFIEEMSEEILKSKLENFNLRVGDICKDIVKEMQMSCSIGIVSACGKNRDFEYLQQWVIYALGVVKKNGKRSLFIVDPEEEEEAPETAPSVAVHKMHKSSSAVIRTADDLIMFSLELLESVEDRASGLRMVSDRICSFFDVDDIAFIANDAEHNEKVFHWSRRIKHESRNARLPEAQEAWKYIWETLNRDRSMILHKDEISRMPGTPVGGLLFANPQKGDGTVCAIFVDRENDRDWEKEKEPLIRLTDILYNHLKQLSDSQKERSEIEFQMNYDSLTKLPQYHKFIRLATQHYKEHPERQFCFAYCDFSNFQYMNELYGYTEGDLILQSFAGCLRRLPEGICFTRVNSDHFVGFLDASEGVDKVRETILEATQEFCGYVNSKYTQNNLVMITGVSTIEQGEELVTLAIDRANIARKYGKGLVTTSVLLYNQEIREKTELEKSIAANMAYALENGEFQAWLQPKISLITGKVVGAEALVRWIKPDGTMIYPDSFIPIFEKNGFITQVDFAVLDQVLDYLHRSMEKGEEVVPVSVNFSRRHNDDAGFVEDIMRKLKEKDIPAGYLEAEVTESIFMMDLTALMENLRKLKALGIAISIDDFGSGYSSLNVLANVEADIIKMDKQFLDSTGTNPQASRFIKSLVGMMKGMGYEVIAEGVETKEQVAILEDAGCDMVQGFFYARPMPLVEFGDFLRDFNKTA